MKRNGYSRNRRLTRESDLNFVKKAGRRLCTEHLEVRTVTSLLSRVRLAVIVGKHRHTVVERNRLRRRLRELARTRLIPDQSEIDIVIRSFPTAYSAAFDVLMKEVEEISRQLVEKREAK